MIEIEQYAELGILLIYLFYIVRTIIILLGWLKGVVLHTFEQYGGEPRFRPLADLVFLIVLLLLLLEVWIIPPVRFLTFSLGAAMLIGGIQTLEDMLGWLMRRLSPRLGELYSEAIVYFPTWYRDLASRTSRYERRRIAYMWLRLSPHQRHLLDRDTPTFLHWTDFVIMGAVMEEDLETKPIPKTSERGYFH